MVYQENEEVASPTKIVTVQTPFLNSKQAAEYLGYAPGTMAIWRHFKRGPKYYVRNGRVRYHLNDLNEFVTGGPQERRRVSPNVGRPFGSKNKARKTTVLVEKKGKRAGR